MSEKFSVTKERGFNCSLKEKHETFDPISSVSQCSQLIPFSQSGIKVVLLPSVDSFPVDNEV